MKFAEHLGAHITPEWRKQYINYEEMKALLYAAIEQAPAVEAIEPHVLERYFSKFDETFFHYCDKELAKINTFYSEKLAEAMRRYATLTSELSGVQTVVDEVKSGGHKGPYNGRIIHKKPVPARKIRELKLAFSEFYLSLILLQNYQNLNFTGFRKILKKHDKHIIEMASIFGIVWTLSVLGFLYSDNLGVSPFVQPVLLYAGLMAFLFNPTKTLRHEARFWALRVMGRIFCAPFFYVGFADFWLADQLNSLQTVFLDLQYFVCFYTKNSSWTRVTDAEVCILHEHSMRPFVACLPAWFRFAQCLRRYRDTKEIFPHLANASKYATSFFVVIFSYLHLAYANRYQTTTQNPYFYLWVVASVVSSCFAYTWDVKLDWGLLEVRKGENKFLREEIVYTSPYYYYFAIVEDFILRFGWAFSLSLTEMGYVHADLMVSIVAPLEVFRRFVWNFFRLENEHLNNCGKFRAVRDISIAPIDRCDRTQILRMMDATDGVRNRRNEEKNDRPKSKSSCTLMPDVETTLKDFRN
ncbi:xenotropic and polytropic retrovirus receptor 1-like isoform X6 [Neodiprion virginianus]|uniref:xenotropic and polytropic retrovirus receptor 1-like isoform X6 n=1 Tax=Neodiprion virginianus TaxID=2961670 RepID=UPI001EE6B494|nr:xenotropic and polytropic retrovirus receptor 1-like isoform X6 [Neodiprion virginianus]